MAAVSVMDVVNFTSIPGSITQPVAIRAMDAETTTANRAVSVDRYSTVSRRCGVTAVNRLVEVAESVLATVDATRA